MDLSKIKSFKEVKQQEESIGQALAAGTVLLFILAAIIFCCLC